MLPEVLAEPVFVVRAVVLAEAAEPLAAAFEAAV